MNENKTNLSKKELNKLISIKTGLNESIIKFFNENLLIYFRSLLISNKTIKIKNFGKFIHLKKKSRIGRNPKTKKKYIIKERTVIKFSPSNNLINSLNND